jgi:hypothetical protein
MEIILNGHGLPTRARQLKRRRLLPNIDLLAVPALAAPSGTESAQETITALRASGYKAIVNKVGAVSLAQCTVTAAQPGRQITQLVGSGDDKVTKVLYTTVYVDVKC